MRRKPKAQIRRFPIIPCWVSGVTLLVQIGGVCEEADFAAPIRSLLEEHCVRCHGGEKTEGGADLTGLTDELDLVRDRELWESVIEQVENEEMPPKGPFPTGEERTRLSGWLRERLDGIDWSRHRRPGHVTLPRLTKEEYRNTLRDLLGVDLRAGESLPDDGEGASGFTNDRDALSIGEAQLDRYEESARRAVAGVLALTRPPAAGRIEAETMERSPAKLAARSDGVTLVHPDHEVRAEWDFPADGWYRFRLSAATRDGPPCVADLRIDGELAGSADVAAQAAGQTEMVEILAFVPASRHAVSIQSRNLVPRTPLPPDVVRLVDERARERAPRLGPLSADEPEAVREAREDLNLKAWGIQECHEWLRELGPGGDPRQIDLRRVYLRERSQKWERQLVRLAAVAGRSAEDLRRLWEEQNAGRLAENAALLAAVAEVKWEDWSRWQGRLFVDRLEWSGPVRPGGPAVEWTLADALSDPVAEPRSIFADFLPRAFRRPVAEADVDRYAAAIPEAGWPAVLTAVLTSPRFLYRDELAFEAGGAGEERALDDHALASRLSYFLWQTLPDGELSDLADAGLLNHPETLATQADRMLDDERAGAFFNAFALDWLGLRELGRTVAPDASKFPDFTPELAAAMREETVRTLAAVFREGRPAVELIDSGTAYWNGMLAGHYGVAGIEGADFRPVTVTDGRRGGLLGMGSVLVATSSPARTNPVRRGAWVLERLLGEDPGEPLPTAGELPGEAGESRGRTLREELDLHRTRAECARCHEKIDPIGFAMENYDAVGRWRDLEAGKPVDASGQLPGGRVFAGPEGLKAALLERRDDFEENLYRRLLAYALGRELHYFDEPEIRDRMAEFATGDRSARSMVRLVVRSVPFRRQSPE